LPASLQKRGGTLRALGSQKKVRGRKRKKLARILRLQERKGEKKKSALRIFLDAEKEGRPTRGERDGETVGEKKNARLPWPVARRRDEEEEKKGFSRRVAPQGKRK